MLSTGVRRAVRAWVVLVLIFLYAPLLLVVINAFNSSRSFAFPPSGFTFEWWVDAANSQGMWESLANSVVVGLGATVIALPIRQQRAAQVTGATWHRFVQPLPIRGRHILALEHHTVRSAADRAEQEHVSAARLERGRLDP